MKLDLNSRFIENEYQLYLFYDVFEIIKAKLTEAQKLISQKTEEKLKSPNLDEGEIQYLMQHRHQLIDESIPRFFMNPLILNLWALLETTTIEIAEYIRVKENQKLKLRDIRGDNFINQAIKYFEHVLQIQLFDPQTTSQLDKIRILRNIIAHNNGRMETIKSEKDKEKIIKWSKEEPEEINIDYGYLVCSDSMIEKSSKLISDQLKELIKRTKEKYP